MCPAFVLKTTAEKHQLHKRDKSASCESDDDATTSVEPPNDEEESVTGED